MCTKNVSFQTFAVALCPSRLCCVFRLAAQHATLLNQNQELEDRLINVVDKIERDKSLLSDEIDHLAEKLACATNTIDYMKNECVSAGPSLPFLREEGSVS